MIPCRPSLRPFSHANLLRDVAIARCGTTELRFVEPKALRGNAFDGLID